MTRQFSLAEDRTTQPVRPFDLRLERTTPRHRDNARLAALYARPYDAVKRCFDIVAAATGIVLVAPLLIAIALAIKLDSRGPVLYGQTRIGRMGRPFRVLKFRTMVSDAWDQPIPIPNDNGGDPRLWKVRSDPRITPIGAVLRRTSLDELPQLINVLLGDMSLVGPRPLFPADAYEFLKDEEDRFVIRELVRPGLTGPAQVTVVDNSRIWDLSDILEQDVRYVATRSFMGDVRILLKTLPAVIRRRERY